MAEEAKHTITLMVRLPLRVPRRKAARGVQKALMEARICLLGAGPTGTETLKNLVLPGCGYICVVDGGVVTQRDCANNFFVDVASIGQPRAKVRPSPCTSLRRHVLFRPMRVAHPGGSRLALANTYARYARPALSAHCCTPLQVAMELLVEMNDDVKGSYRAEDPASLLATDPGFFTQFSLVIATQMPQHVLAPLAALLYQRSIPLMVRVSLRFLREPQRAATDCSSCVRCSRVDSIDLVLLLACQRSADCSLVWADRPLAHRCAGTPHHRVQA